MSKRNRHPIYGMAIYSAVLTQLAGSVLIGIFIGRWADRSMDTEPLFLVIGLLAGLTVGIIALFITIRQFFSED